MGLSRTGAVCGHHRAHRVFLAADKATDMTGQRPKTYEQLWDDYRLGRMSTVTLRHLIRVDEVFRVYCVRAAEKLKAEHAKAGTQDPFRHTVE